MNNFIKSGWRPFIGWSCGAGIFNAFVLSPWVAWFSSSPPPELQVEYLTTMVATLLGLSGYRTIEKIKKVSV